MDIARKDAAPPDPAVTAVLERRGHDPGQLVQILRELQEWHGWLPPAALADVSRALGIALARVRGVAGFYSFLASEPRGLYRVLFSDNVTDRMQGSEALMADF